MLKRDTLCWHCSVGFDLNVVRNIIRLFKDRGVRCVYMKKNMKVLSQTELLERNSVFHNCHKGRRCFVICTGPSIKKQDLSPLTHEITFVVNAFWKHPLSAQLQPSYYFFADNRLFDGTEPLLKSDMKITMQQFFTEVRTRIHSTSFFVPLGASKNVHANSLLPLERTYFMPFQGLLSNGLSEMPDFTKTIPSVENVSQVAIMAAMYMGCSPIYLLGLDHDWLSDQGLHKGINKHFYDDSSGSDTLVARWSYKHLLESALRVWNGYESLLRIANRKSIRIFNATGGGFLDVFNLADYDDIVMRTPDFKPVSTVEEQESNKICRIVNETLGNGDHQGSLLAILRAINLYPDSQALIMLEADLRSRLGDREGAKRILLDIVERWPENSKAHHNLAIILWHEEDIQKALLHFANAMQLAPNDRSIALDFGKALTILGKLEDAQVIFSAYLKFKPDDEEIACILENLVKS